MWLEPGLVASGGSRAAKTEILVFHWLALSSKYRHDAKNKRVFPLHGKVVWEMVVVGVLLRVPVEDGSGVCTIYMMLMSRGIGRGKY